MVEKKPGPRRSALELEFLTTTHAASPGKGVWEEMGVARMEHPYNQRSLVVPGQEMREVEEAGRIRLMYYLTLARPRKHK